MISKRIRPRSQGTLSTGSIAPGLTTLSVSLLHGRFHAVAVHRGTVTASWDAPGLVHQPSELATAVKQAALATGYNGSTVRMVLSHPRLVSSLSAAPPSKGGSLNRVLQRVVEREKTFDGPAVWCHQVTPSGETGSTVLLHLFPAELLEQYLRACEQGAGLTLVSVVPACAVLHGQILELPEPACDAVMVVAGLGSSSILLVGQQDGSVLLARSVPASWTGDLARLLADVGRTALYTKEHFGKSLTHILLFGAEAMRHRVALQAPFEIPVRLSMAEEVPNYWATAVLRLPPAIAPNLVSLAQQRAPHRRAVTRTVRVATVILLLATLGMLGWSHLQMHRLENDLAKLERQRERLEPNLGELKRSFAELQSMQAMRMGVCGNRPDPMVALSLGYLSEVVPEKLILKRFSILQEGPIWRIEYRGALLPTPDPPHPSPFPTQVGVLTNRLGLGPLHLRISKSEITSPEQKLGSEEAAVLERYRDRVKTAPPDAAPPAVSHAEFVVEGITPVTYNKS